MRLGRLSSQSACFQSGLGQVVWFWSGIQSSLGLSFRRSERSLVGLACRCFPDSKQLAFLLYFSTYNIACIRPYQPSCLRSSTEATLQMVRRYALSARTSLFRGLIAHTPSSSDMFEMRPGQNSMAVDVVLQHTISWRQMLLSNALLLYSMVVCSLVRSVSSLCTMRRKPSFVLGCWSVAFKWTTSMPSKAKNVPLWLCR